MNEVLFSDEKVRNRYVLTPQEKIIRKRFLRKVISIMSGQLFITIASMIPISFYEPARNFLNEKTYIVILSVFLMAVFTMFLVFCSWLARFFVVNYAILFLLTAFTSFWMTCLCVKYTHVQVAMAIGITIVASLVLYLFAIKTYHDCTVLLGVLLVVSLIAIIMGIAFFVVQHYQYNGAHHIKWFIQVGSVILTCVYFVVDVQMIVTGDRTFFLDLESPVIGACIMYIDFVYLFIYILMIYGDLYQFKLGWSL